MSFSRLVKDGQKLDPHLALDEGFWPGGEDAAQVLTGDNQIVAQLRSRSYAKCGAVVADTSSLLSLVTKVRSHGWPPIFSALSPRFWQHIMPAARSLSSSVYGGGTLARRLWLTHVSPVAGAHGWRPHLDAHHKTKLRDGLPEALTMIVALTEATIDNGCLHILPRAIAGDFPSDIFTKKTIEAARILPLLHGARALPCPAGHALLWSKDLAHWGGYASGDSLVPRVSVTMEIQHPALDGISLAKIPDFPSRVRLVGEQILKYRHYQKEKSSLAPFIALATTMAGL